MKMPSRKLFVATKFLDDSSLKCSSVGIVNSAIKKRDSVVKLLTFKEKKSGRIKGYRFVSMLGAGSFAKVSLCTQRKSGKFFAVKTMNKKALKSRVLTATGRTAYDAVMEELCVLQQLEHPNVIWLHEIVD